IGKYNCGLTHRSKPASHALRRLQREQGPSSHVFMTERDGPMTPKAFHALFGRIGARAKMQFPIHPHKQCACTLKARRPAHSALAGAERACMHLVRPLADTPWSRSLPICGQIGVSLSILCSGLLPSGGASQTNMVLASPCTDPYCSPARVRLGGSVCGSLTPCRWRTLQHDRFANSLLPQFLNPSNDPKETW